MGRTTLIQSEHKRFVIDLNVSFTLSFNQKRSSLSPYEYDLFASANCEFSNNEDEKRTIFSDVRLHSRRRRSFICRSCKIFVVADFFAGFK